MDAPKKIWIKVGIGAQLHAEYTDYRFKTKYIRADLADGLVEALKICLARNGYDFDERPAEAALKAMEEE